MNNNNINQICNDNVRCTAAVGGVAWMAPKWNTRQVLQNNKVAR